MLREEHFGNYYSLHESVTLVNLYAFPKHLRFINFPIPGKIQNK
jgi:hypothetical protein